MNNYMNLAKSYMFSNRRRTINNMLGISLAVALFFGMLTLYMSVKDCNVRSTQWIAGNYEIYLMEVDGKTYKELLDDKKIKDTMLFNYREDIGEIFFYLSEEKYDGIYIDYFEVGEVNDDMMGISLQSGRYPENNNEIVLSDQTMKYLSDYEIGDVISFEFRKTEFVNDPDYVDENGEKSRVKRIYTEKEYTLVGIFEQNYIYDGGYSDWAKGFSVIDRENQPAYCNLKIKLANRNDVEGDLRYFCNKYNVGGALDSVGYLYTNDEKDASSLLTYILSFFAFWFMFFVCVFIIRNSFIISVAERTKDYGILRYVGMSKKQLVGMLLSEGLMLGVLANILGMIISYVGLLVIRVLMTGLIKELGYNEFFYIGIYPIVVLITIIFTSIAISFSLIEPARVAGLITPIDAIKGRKTIKKEKLFKSRSSFIVRKILGVEGDYAVKNIKRNRGKFVSTCVGISLSVLLFVGLNSISNLVKDMFLIEDVLYDGSINMENDFWQYGYGSNRNYEEIDLADYMEEINQIEGISNIILKYEKSSFCGEEKLRRIEGKDNFHIKIYGYEREQIDGLKKYLVDGNIDYDSMTEDEVILCNYYKKTYVDTDNNTKDITIKLSDVEVGDTIKIPDDRKINEYIDKNPMSETIKEQDYWEYACKLVEDGYCREVTVVAIVEADDIVNNGNYAVYFHNKPSLIFNKAGYMKNGAQGYPQGSEVLFKAEDALAFENVKDFTVENRKFVFYDVFDGVRMIIIGITCIRYISYVVIGIILLICMFNMMNNLSSNIILRKKELETYRIVGMSKKQVDKLLIIEGTMAAITGTIIGSIIGSGIAYSFFKLLAESTNDIHYKIPVGSIIVALILTIGISMLSTWSITRRKKY